MKKKHETEKQQLIDEMKASQKAFHQELLEKLKKEKEEFHAELREQKAQLRSTFEDKRTELRRNIYKLRISSEPIFHQSPPTQHEGRQKFENQMENK